MRPVSKFPLFFSLTAIFAIGFLLRAFFFLVSIEHLPTTSDEALSLLMARAIREGARPLLFWGTPYQFPFESYLIAPFVELLGHRAFAARIVLAVLGSLSTIGFYILLRKTYKAPPLLASLLVIFPSAYLLTLQAAYFIPQYTATATWAWVLPLMAAPVLSTEKRHPLFCIGSGLLAGFALSNHLLSLPLVAAVAVAICLGNSAKSLVKRSLLFLPSLLIGLIPYIAVYPTVKEAALTVHGSYPLLEGVKRFFQSAMNENLQVVIGPELSLFPDYAHAGGLFTQASPLILGLFWLTLILATLIRLRVMLNRWSWPSLKLQDIFVLTTWLALFAFALSKRGIAGEYRYLLPVAWCFPFLVATVLMRLSGKIQLVANSVATVLLLINVFNSFYIIHNWRKPILAEHQDLRHIGKLKRYLNKRGIQHCFASFWHVNRITFETNRRITCSQPFNDRFPGWPLPYLDTVEKADRVAYVLNNSHFARVSARRFEGMLARHNLTATTKQLHGYKAYHDFRYKDVESSVKTAAPSPLTSEPTDQLIDGERTPVDTENIATFAFRFEKPVRLHRLRLFWDLKAGENYSSFSIELFKGDRNVHTSEKLIPREDTLYMRGNFPIFHKDNRQDIVFMPQQVDTVNILVHKTAKQFPLNEVEFYKDSVNTAELATERDLETRADQP
jgi:4-amino-4-deoxy-L-arabinose transferase-like glycosyltransferase